MAYNSYPQQSQQSQQGQQGQQRKFWSFVHLTRSVTAENVPFVGITVHGPVRKPDEALGYTQQSNTPVMHFTMPIQGKEEYIAGLCGQMPDLTEDGTILAKVSLFGKTAERFAAFLQKHPKADVCVVGKLEIDNWTGNDNSPHSTAKITATDFFLVRDIGEKKQTQGYTPQGGASAPQQGGWGQQAPAATSAPPQGGGWGATPAPQQGGWASPQSGAPAQQSRSAQPGWSQPPQNQNGPAPQGGSWASPQGGAPTQQPPQQSGGWGTPQNGPAPRNSEGFVDLDDEDGELPF